MAAAIFSIYPGSSVSRLQGTLVKLAFTPLKPELVRTKIVIKQSVIKLSDYKIFDYKGWLVA